MPAHTKAADDGSHGVAWRSKPWPSLAPWRAHGLKPHRVESFKISRDPEFSAELEDVVGLHLNPLEHSLVLSVGERH